MIFGNKHKELQQEISSLRDEVNKTARDVAGMRDAISHLDSSMNTILKELGVETSEQPERSRGGATKTYQLRIKYSLAGTNHGESYVRTGNFSSKKKAQEWAVEEARKFIAENSDRAFRNRLFILARVDGSGAVVIGSREVFNPKEIEPKFRKRK